MDNSEGRLLTKAHIIGAVVVGFAIAVAAASTIAAAQSGDSGDATIDIISTAVLAAVAVTFWLGDRFKR